MCASVVHRVACDASTLRELRARCAHAYASRTIELRFLLADNLIPIPLKSNFCSSAPLPPIQRTKLHYAIVFVIVTVVASRGRGRVGFGPLSFGPRREGKSENWQRVAHFSSVPCFDAAEANCYGVRIALCPLARSLARPVNDSSSSSSSPPNFSLHAD